LEVAGDKKIGFDCELPDLIMGKVLNWIYCYLLPFQRRHIRVATN